MAAKSELTTSVIELAFENKDCVKLSPSCSQAMILHYSGYGYAKRGAPFWLLSTVRHFRHQYPDTPWLSMFHEVAASGPVTTSAFWLQPFQRHIARHLLKLSTAAFTNCSVNADLLHQLAPGEKHKLSILPVFSNFGELSSPPSVADRLPHLVLFTSNLAGRPPSQEFWDMLSTAISRYAVTQLTVIGRPLENPPQLSVPLVQTGFLDATDVSALLANARFGYAFHGPLLLGKSGIFAAFASHGVIPIIPVDCEVLPDHLESSLHFLRYKDTSTDSQLKAIQANLLKWYQPHCIHETAARYTNALHLPLSG